MKPHNALSFVLVNLFNSRQWAALSVSYYGFVQMGTAIKLRASPWVIINVPEIYHQAETLINYPKMY